MKGKEGAWKDGIGVKSGTSHGTMVIQCRLLQVTFDGYGRINILK